MPTYARSLTTSQYRALLTNLPALCPTTVFTVGGQPYTAADLVAIITSILDATSAVGMARATWLQALETIATLEASDGKLLRDVRGILAVMFNNAPATLAVLEIEPPKVRAPLTAEERVVATAKLRATREARGTKSKKQKARIKGAVTGVTITPVVAGEAGAEGVSAPENAANGEGPGLSAEARVSS